MREHVPAPLRGKPLSVICRTLFIRFFLIALFIVGGGLAILAAADRLFVKKLHWLDEGELLEMYPIFQMVPGLIAGNVALYVGFRSAGAGGALAALGGVVLPSYLVILIVALFFQKIPLELPWVQGAFIGVRTVMSGLSIALLWKIWKNAMKSNYAWPVMILCFLGMGFWRANPGLLILGAMAVGIFFQFRDHTRQSGEAGVITLFALFFYFGALCFGGGSLLHGFYINELVHVRNWMSLEELANFMAVSQVTPGPIGINLATFIGFRHLGIPGATAATLGLIAPSCIAMILVLTSLEKWSSSPWVKGALAGMQPASAGLLLGVWIICLQLSVFTADIPWRYLGELCAGSFHAYTGSFSIRYAALPLFAVSVWLLRFDKCPIMAAIFSGAFYGALFCH